jgi:hypothetical protein
MSTTRGLTFTTTVWMINWVHNNASNGWSHTAPTGRTRFTKRP